MSTTVFVRSGSVKDILPTNPVTTGNLTGGWVYKDSPQSAIHGVVVGTGAVGCTITLQVSNDAVYPLSTALGTITLSGTTFASDGFTTNAPWKYIRAVVSASSGTISSITCNMSI